MNLEIAQFASDIGVLNHGTPRDNDFAAVGHRGIGDLLQTVDMARKARDDDAAFGIFNDLAQGLSHLGLRRGEIGILRVRRVGHHQIDANLAKAGKRTEVRMNAVNGALIELKSPVCKTLPAGDCMNTPTAPGME